MNDLRLLLQIDPHKKVISLEFKQIISLDPMMPLLLKFEDLQSLSLHGNRLKNLPKDMSGLVNLVELDISNNLFLDINDLVESLKSLPALSHLIMNFKSHQEQIFIKNSLPNLQRINKKPVSSHKADFSYSQKKKKQTQRLNETDLESIGVLYDQIREIYRDSKYPAADKQLANDFDRNVENIMSELAHKIKGNESEVERNCNIIIGKYALIDLCFVKLITYFYQNNKKIANTFEKIHDQQAEMFKSITDIVFAEALRNKIEVTQVKVQKQQLYKAEIKRLKSYQTQLNRQLQYLENKNKELIERLMKTSKSGAFDNAISRLNSTSSPNRSPTKLISSYKAQSYINNKDKDNATIVTVKNKPKSLSLNQLKQIMGEIYQSKKRYNSFCLENGQSFETMQTHMYTYLNQKYGLKSLAVEWVMSIVAGIKKYGLEDPEVATFGKILRNQVDESFLAQVQRLKESFMQNYKRFKKNLTQGQSTELSINQSEQILLFMNLKREQIALIVSKIKQDKLTNNMITVEKLQKSLLDYFVRKHDQHIFELHKQFKLVDQDEDGVIDVDQLSSLMKSMNQNIEIDMLVELLDPSKRGIIAWFYLCEVLAKHPEFKDFFKVPE